MPKLPALRDIVTVYSKHYYEGASFLLEEYETEFGIFSFEGVNKSNRQVLSK